MTEKTCGHCWFWERLAHPLDFSLGRCKLLEREQRDKQWCEFWEPQQGEVVPFPCSAERASGNVQKSD